ncbi:MAG: hypothetical protein Q9182_000271 [Xanthomendoza sp. 2 TL-2023]
MASEKPSPQHWTLRFKCHKTTILLLVSPHDSLSSIKEKLLQAIIATQVVEINGQPLPSDPDHVIFGVPADTNEPDGSWIELEIPEPEDDNRKKGSKKSGVLNATPMGAGLKDGSVLAFRFHDEATDADDLGMDKKTWTVIMPTFDDEDGSQMKEIEAV